MFLLSLRASHCILKDFSYKIANSNLHLYTCATVFKCVYLLVFLDDMNLPGDIPSYLSSQGTLSEPQEVYSNSEAGSHQQLMPPSSNGYVHKGTDGKM